MPKIRFSIVLTALVLSCSACGGESDSEVGGPIMLPSMIGMNLQGAQDCLQEIGFWNLDDQPAAGESRFQVNDSNWTVTDQSPEPGMVSSRDQQITLYARKTGGWGANGEGSWACPDGP
jgi:hypothetical protein